MIEIKKATHQNIEALALLARVTYVESHGHFIDDKNDLFQYANKAFSVDALERNMAEPNSLYYILYVEQLPVGYLKLVMNAEYENIASKNNCRLERIYILNEFIPMKLGQQLMTLAEEKARELQSDNMWLSVYTKNKRALRFYEKNGYKCIGVYDFFVNGKNYENIVLAKDLSA